MRYFIVGLLVGICIALSPILIHENAHEITAQWHVSLAELESIEVSRDPSLGTAHLIATPFVHSILSFARNGSLIRKTDLPDDTLFSLSGSGNYYASYRKVGDEIEFTSTSGDRLWKIASKEYPYVSPKGKIVLLLVADLSKVRFIDYNGNEIGDMSISGRMCTVISFAKKSDTAAIGFLDGSVFVISEKGKVLYSGKTPKGTIAKSIALSDNAGHLAVHYGTADKDGMLTINIVKKKTRAFALPVRHLTRTALHIGENGDIAILNGKRLILADSSGDIIATSQLADPRPGHSALVFEKGLYAISYRRSDGGSELGVFTHEGIPVFRKTFTDESFLDCDLRDGILIARGLGSMYAWHVE
jgi:hypothetical protein